MTFPLTSACGWDYAFLTTGIPVVEIGVSVKRRITALCGFFMSVKYRTVLFGRVVWGTFGFAGTFSRYANLHDSAHPYHNGEAENLNRLKRSFTMAKSKAVRSGRRSTDLTSPSSVRCRRGDLAILLEGSYSGCIVDVVEYYATVAIDSGEVLVNAWHIRHSSDEPNTQYFKEDKYLLPGAV